MIDAHCHLVDAKYQGRDIQTIVEEAKNAGVEMIVNGTGVSESEMNIKIAENNDGVWVCVGAAYELGYTDLKKMKTDLKKLCQSSKVVGIGEAGLNYYSGISDELKNYQRRLFEGHVELAKELGLPIQVHNREADEDIYKILNSQGVTTDKVLLHCFSGSVEFMRQMAGWGCYFSFGGMITYKKNDELREVVKQVPTDRLVLETDAPYLPPEPLRGSINTPVNVKIVAKKMAEILGQSVGEVETLTTNNTRRLFSEIR